MRQYIILAILACLTTAGLLKAQAPAAPAGPAVTITLGSRHGHVTPVRKGCTHTGGGNIDVAQPSPDTVVITMTGVAVAYCHPCKDSHAGMTFDLEQCLEIGSDNAKIKGAKLTIEGRVIGLLRSHCKTKGSAEQSPGCAAIACGPAEVIRLCVPPHSVSCGEDLSLNCREGALTVPVTLGSYTLHQTWGISATHPHCLKPCEAPSAEFAPDLALDPLWISYWEPFHGVAKKDFGFQITIKVAADESVAETKKVEVTPKPKKVENGK